MRRSTGPARDLRVLASGRSAGPRWAFTSALRRGEQFPERRRLLHESLYQSHMGVAQPFELCGIASPILDLGKQTDGRRLVYMSREVVEKVLRNDWRRDNDGADI